MPPDMKTAAPRTISRLLMSILDENNAVLLRNPPSGGQIGVVTPSNDPIESRQSAQNKMPRTATRIRVSWLIVVLIFVLLGMTSVIIMLH